MSWLRLLWDRGPGAGDRGPDMRAGGWGTDNPNKIKTVTKYFKQFYDVFIIKKLFIKKLFINEAHIIKHHR